MPTNTTASETDAGVRETLELAREWIDVSVRQVRPLSQQAAGPGEAMLARIDAAIASLSSPSPGETDAGVRKAILREFRSHCVSSSMEQTIPNAICQRIEAALSSPSSPVEREEGVAADQQRSQKQSLHPRRQQRERDSRCSVEFALGRLLHQARRTIPADPLATASRASHDIRIGERRGAGMMEEGDFMGDRLGLRISGYNSEIDKHILAAARMIIESRRENVDTPYTDQIAAKLGIERNYAELIQYLLAGATGRNGSRDYREEPFTYGVSPRGLFVSNLKEAEAFLVDFEKYMEDVWGEEAD